MSAISKIAMGVMLLMAAAQIGVCAWSNQVHMLAKKTINSPDRLSLTYKIESM